MDYQRWFEDTWTEREEEFRRLFGESWPPGSPQGHVISFSWKDPKLVIPGACAMVFPPIGEAPGRDRRDDWLYVTHGLTQPRGPEEVRQRRAAGDSRSGYGWELGFVVDEPDEWIPSTLYGLLTFISEGENLDEGHRFQFGFHREGNSLRTFTGPAEEVGVTPVSDIGAILFWRYLFPAATIFTETGTCRILIATAITEEEWTMARETTSAHVQLLLCRAGVGQRSLPFRSSVTREPRWADAWEKIRSLPETQVVDALNQGIGRWQPRDASRAAAGGPASSLYRE